MTQPPIDMTDDYALNAPVSPRPRKRLYISGPMSGHPDHNFPAFNLAALHLRLAGYDVVNPAGFQENIGRSWIECIIHDLKELATCDAVATLPGWQDSPGANVEVIAAVREEKTVDSVSGWLVKGYDRAVALVFGDAA